MTALALFLAVLVGMVLGAVGGGGAVLMVPVLVLVAGEDIREATTTSLLIVSAAAAVGAALPAREGRIAWGVVISLASAAVPASYVGALANERLDPVILSQSFAALLLVVAIAMWRRAGGQQERPSRPLSWEVALGVGAATGFLTGTFGVGGGFLILPALVLVMGLSVSRAVGTSLAIVCVVSGAALIGHVLRGAVLDTARAVPFTLAVLAGAWGGSRLGARLPHAGVLRAFAGLLVVAAVAMLAT